MNDVIELIEAFAIATSTRDTDTLRKIMHDDYRVIALTSDGVRNIPKDTYLQMMDDKKLGGSERGLEIHSLDVKNRVALVSIRHIASDKFFDERITAIKTDGGWKMLFNCSEVNSRKA